MASLAGMTSYYSEDFDASIEGYCVGSLIGQVNSDAFYSG